MNLFPSLFHHSGGILYHFRASRYGKNLWNPHRDQTQAFLKEWNPKSKTLYLIGPSGGYSLPTSWLNQFELLIAIEPDPLARYFFQRHTGILPTWIKKPFRFEDLAKGEFRFDPGAAILFCNLLGQIPFDEAQGLAAQEWLEQLAVDHELASYHDILSGNHFRFDWSSPMDGEEPIREKFEIEALDPYFSPTEGTSELDLHVHPAAFLFQQSSFRYQYWEWQITPDQTQVIEGVYSRR